jgi:hypothetical protein
LGDVQFYARHPYTAINDTEEKRTDLIWLGIVPPDAPSYSGRPLRELYDVYCQKFKVREPAVPDEPDYYMLYCRFPGQKAQSEGVNRDVLESDHDVWLDVTLSEEIKTVDAGWLSR